MNGKLYWKNRLPFLLTNLVCMIALTVFLFVCGNSLSAVLLILIAWIVIVSVGLGFTYWKRKRQMQRLLDMTEQLSERYLISEVMELPEQAEDQVYYRILKMAGKSMLEQISEVKRERLEYKEYIEQWIHEIKTPITAMKLLCENHRTDWTKELLLELEKTNRFTEQALYYARSEHTEKDYSVREITLSNVVHQAIADNKYLLLQNGVHLKVEEIQDTVYSDEKWVEDGRYPKLRSDLRQFLNSGKWLPDIQPGQELPEKVTMGVTVKAWGVANSLTGFTTISFCGLYLSIIFIILSCSVLAFEQLSAIDKSQKNYAVIDRLGVSAQKQASLIRKELSTVFLIPLFFPIVLTILLVVRTQFIFGEAILQEGLVLFYGAVTILLFCATYLTYFGATLFLFKKVILRPEMR